MEAIRVSNLTISYKNKKEIFPLNFIVNRGEIYGIVGIKNSGKSTIFYTLIHCIETGNKSITLFTQNSNISNATLRNSICYIPDGINFYHKANGILYILYQVYHNPEKEFLFLDEPFKSLKTYEKEEIIQLLIELKNKGKTILISSESFKELASFCQKIMLVHNGKQLMTVKCCSFDKNKERQYRIGFHRKEEYESFLNKEEDFIINSNKQYKQVILKVSEDNVARFLTDLNQYDIRKVEFVPFAEERLFVQDTEFS